jgi:hypothetical protein
MQGCFFVGFAVDIAWVAMRPSPDYDPKAYKNFCRMTVWVPQTTMNLCLKSGHASPTRTRIIYVTWYFLNINERSAVDKVVHTSNFAATCCSSFKQVGSTMPVPNPTSILKPDGSSNIGFYAHLQWRNRQNVLDMPVLWLNSLHVRFITLFSMLKFWDDFNCKNKTANINLKTKFI